MTTAADRTSPARETAGASVTRRPARTTTTRFCLVLAEIASPAVLVTALLLAIAWHDAPDPGHALLWGAVSVLFATVAPTAFVLHGVRRRRWSDHHVPERSRRTAPLLFCGGSVAVGYLLLRLADAPKGLIAVTAAIVVEALVLTSITRLWKISGHVAAAASCATVVTVVYGPVLAPSWLLVPVLAWARVQVRRARLAEAPTTDHDELDGHTPAQTVAGAMVATVTVTTVYLLMGAL